MYARKILFNKVKFDVRTGLLYVQEVESYEMILFLFVRCGTCVLIVSPFLAMQVRVPYFLLFRKMSIQSFCRWSRNCNRCILSYNFSVKRATRSLRHPYICSIARFEAINLSNFQTLTTPRGRRGEGVIE